MNAVVVIPTYNERENVVPLIERIVALPCDLDLFFVDDASPDGTGQLLDSLRPTYPCLRVMHRPGKLGLGTAYRDAYRDLLKEPYDLFLMMDADLSHPPESIPELLKASENSDLVLGSRYCPGGNIRHWSVSRRLLSRTANQVARSLLVLKERDVTAGFRCYRREVITALDGLNLRSNGYAFHVETTYHCQLMGYRIAEVPIVFDERFHEASKMSCSEIVGAIKTVSYLWWSLRRKRLSDCGFGNG